MGRTFTTVEAEKEVKKPEAPPRPQPTSTEVDKHHWCVLGKWRACRKFAFTIHSDAERNKKRAEVALKHAVAVKDAEVAVKGAEVALEDAEEVLGREVIAWNATIAKYKDLPAGFEGRKYEDSAFCAFENACAMLAERGGGKLYDLGTRRRVMSKRLSPEGLESKTYCRDSQYQ